MRVLLAFVTLAWSGLAFAAETWVEIKAPNFVVISNAGQGIARSTAVEFEQVRAAPAGRSRRGRARIWAGSTPKAAASPKMRPGPQATSSRPCLAGDKRSCVQHAWLLARGEGPPKDEPKAIAALDGLCNDRFFPACTRLAYLYVSKPAPAARARAKALLTRACEGGEQDACTMAKQVR
jgi:TPR repeat protein